MTPAGPDRSGPAEVLDRGVFSVTFDGSGRSLTGWVVVDSLVDAIAMGGTRMTPSVTEAEVRALARAMTTKLGLVGLPIGGAKAGVVERDGGRNKLLRTFGRAVAPLLHGGIHLGCDLGVTQADRKLFHQAAGYDVRERPRSAGLPMDWAAYWAPLTDIVGFGVGVATLTALRRVSPRPGQRVVVQGFGMVGRAVATFLERAGHRVVGVADVLGTVSAAGGLPVDRLLAVTDPAGTLDRAALPPEVCCSAEPDAWLDVDTDVLVLAANRDAVDEHNVHRVRAGLVVEGGNLCCSAGAKAALSLAGTCLVPDVVANVGGAAAGGCALTGTVPFDLPPAQMAAWVHAFVERHVRQNTQDVLELAESSAGDPVPLLLAARRRPAA
ncbi:MAG: Glu/Leu/Phe/Val dehydrogenase dimerization domain-containing protein [Mycobacteriales bacterium]